MKKIASPLFALALVTATLGHAQVTLVSQNFDAVATQTLSGGSSATVGTGTSSLQLTTATSTSLSIADIGSGNNVLQYTDNQNGGAAPNVVSPSFTGVSTNGTGNNYIVGSFDFKALQMTSGSAPGFIFMINASSQVNTGSHSSVIISFGNSGGAATSISYNNGGTNVSNVFTLTANINYRLSLVADYSNTGVANRDSFSFTVTNLDSPGIVYTSPVIETRALADLTPNRMAFYGGAGNTVFNADPFFQIDNINFSATDTAPIPEPSSSAALTGLFIIGCCMMRRSCARQ